MKPSAVIFDLDGTLLNTLEDLRSAVNHALACFSMPGHDLEEMKSFVGNGNPYMIARAVPEGTAPAVEKAVLDEFYAYYRVHYREKTVPYRGIPEMLRALKAAGIKTGVCSNKFHEATANLTADLLPGCIDFPLGTLDGVPRKPAADMPNRILDALGADAEHALYVGDSDVDVNTARNAGIPMLAVTWGFRSVEALKKAGAEALFDTPEELLRTILG